MVNQDMKTQFLLSFFAIIACNYSTADECVDYEEMEFFNSIGGVPGVHVTQEPKSMKNLSGNKVAEKSELISVNLKPEIYLEEEGIFRQLTDIELNTIAFNRPSIELVSKSDEVVEHKASNGKYFTVKELLNAVELTEKKTRKNTNWFGGVDIHHIYF